MRLDNVANDLKQAARTLRRSRPLAVVVVLTLGLALAASVALFSVLDAVLVEPLPFRDAARIVFLRHAQATRTVACSLPTFLDYRRHARSFASLSATRPADFNVSGDDEPERVRGLFVTSEFFETMGVAAARGRTFQPGEDEPGRERVVVISHRLWQRRFGGDPRALGATLRLDGAPYEVVGILPAGFEWSRAFGAERSRDLWAPLPLTREETDESARGNENLDVYARLRPGASLDQAQADLDAVVAALRLQHPRRYTTASGFRVRPVPVQEERVGALRPGLLLVFLAVVALLLTAAANVAGLLLARSVSRRTEMAVRAALGASPARLARQALAEVALLAGIAGVLGIGLASGLCVVLDSIDTAVLPRSRSIALSPLTTAFAALATLVIAAASGLLPAWHAWRGDLAGRERRTLGGRDAARARRALIVGQTALAAALLTGAGLLVRSLAELQRVAPGYRTDDVLASRVRLPQASYADAPRRVAFADDVLARVAEGPGVRAAAVMSEAPLSGSRNSGTFAIDGVATAPGQNPPHAELWSASAGYFATMGIPLRRGRLFDGRDASGATPVVIVSEALARRYFADADPIGRRIDFQGGASTRAWREIVGVVADVHDRRLDREPGPQLYVPYAQRPTYAFSILVRTAGDPQSAAPSVRLAVRSADAALPLYEVAPLSRLVEDTTRERRAIRGVLVGFGAAALLLSALGLYGLLAQSVRERVPEIGLRMAIGADRGNVLRMILASGGRLLVSGLGLGLVLGLATGRLLQGHLFGITPEDPLTYAVVGLVLLAAGLGASFVPAWRASRVDPLTALRAE